MIKEQVLNKTQDKQLDILLFDHLSEVDPKVWNSIVPRDHIICSYEHLRAVEEAGINDCIYRYIMIREEGVLIAHSCFYHIRFDLDIFNTGKSKKIIDYIKKKIYPNFLRITAIECGTPTALGNTITAIPGTDRYRIATIIIGEMERFAREKKIKFIILRDFYDHELFLFDRLRHLGFKRVNNLPNAEIINNWKNFDQYMKDMRSRYRYRIKRFIKGLTKSSIEIEIRDHYSDVADKLTELWFHIYEHAKEYKREILTPAYFRNMEHYLNGRTKVILFKHDGEIIGFDFIVIDDDTLRPLFVGINYDYNKENKLYFNILCQSVKMGIDQNKKLIEMGITTMNPKIEMGAEILPLYAYMKHLSPVLNKILPNLFVLLSPPPREDVKHVFNRRFFERIYTDLNIKYTCNGKVNNAVIKNISLSGVFMEISANVKKGSILTIEFVFPNSFNSFTVRALVIWAKKVKAHYTTGCTFVNVRKKTKDKIYTLMRILKRKGEDEKN